MMKPRFKRKKEYWLHIWPCGFYVPCLPYWSCCDGITEGTGKSLQDAYDDYLKNRPKPWFGRRLLVWFLVMATR